MTSPCQEFPLAWFLVLPSLPANKVSYKKIRGFKHSLAQIHIVRRSHLKNKAWGIYNSEIRTMCVFSSHHNWLRRNCSFSLLQKCFSSGLYDICYCRCQNNRASIFFRILFLFSILNFQMEIRELNTVKYQHKIFLYFRFASSFLYFSWKQENQFLKWKAKERRRT